MVAIQVGSLQQPIILIPRINGVEETVTRIKNVFSNFYVDDTTTPINFVMESRTRTGTKQLLSYDPTKSTDTQIYFFPADAFYATVEKFTLLFYWTIATEKIYTEDPITLDVKELHDES